MKTKRAIDFETYLISNEMPIPKPVCLSWAVPGNNGLLIGKEDMEKCLKRWLEAKELLIAHNATFELLVIYEHFPNLRDLLVESVADGRWFCTQLGQQLLDNISEKELGNKSLAGLVQHYFNEDISESKTDPNAWRLRYSELDGVDKALWPREAIEYAVNDSIWALMVYNEQIKKDSNIKIKAHMQATFALNIMAAPGILVDMSRVKVLEDELNAFLRPHYEMLESKGFMKRDKRGKLSKNVKILREYIEANFEKHRYTPKNDIQVGGTALDEYMLEKEDEILPLFRAIGQYEKAKTAFVARLKKADPVIRTSYNAIVRSGRTSSRATEAYPSVNIQQMPRGLENVTWDIRNCFIPRPGYKLVTIDYNNLELLACAHQLYGFYGSSNMRDLINSGTKPTDLHSMFACELMSADKKTRITYDEFVQNKKKEGWKEYRSKGKPVTLGVPGGLGYDTMRSQFAKDGIKLKYEVLQRCKYEQVARRIVRKYRDDYPSIRVHRTGIREWSVVVDELVGLKKLFFNLYPELGQFLKESHNEFLTGEHGWVKNDFGEWEKEPYYKYSTLGVKRNYCSYTAFCNAYLMQAPSAVGAKNVCWKIFLEFRNNPDVRPLAFIHDELIFEIRDTPEIYNYVDRCAEIMIDGMQEVLTSVRVAVEAEIKPYWSKDKCDWSRQYWKDLNDKGLKY